MAEEIVEANMRRTFGILLALAFLVSWASDAHTAILWSGDTEEGDLRDWYLPCTSAAPCGGEGGGEFNSGSGADTTASNAQVRSGSFAIRQTLNSSSESGTRLFRWAEPAANPEAYYSIWTYFPQGFAPASGSGWWLHNGFKTRRTQGGAVNNLLMLFLDYTFDPNQMYLYLDYFNPTTGNLTRHTQRIKALPVGQWFHTEAYLRQSTSANGQIIVWIDGVEIFNVSGIITRGSGSDGAVHWEATTNYGFNLNPVSITKYVDDAIISTTRVGEEEPPPPPPEAGLVAHYTMDAADVQLSQSASEIRDKSSSALHGDLQNYSGNPVVAGRIGDALKLDGINDLVVIPDNDFFSPAVSDLSTALWVRVPVGTPAVGSGNCGAGGRYIISKGASGAWEWALENDQNNRLCGDIWDLAGNDHGIMNVARSLADGQWHHYAVVYDYLVRATLYIDGVEAVSRTTFSGTMGNGSSAVRIGARGDGNYFAGEVDDVRIYNRAIAASEVTALFNAETEPPLPDTIPPSTPMGLNATAVSNSQIDLTWFPSTDDVGVTGYDIERLGIVVASVTATSYSDTALTPGTYVYRVRAKDAAGNLSGFSSSATATVEEGPPTPFVADIQVSASADDAEYTTGGTLRTGNVGDLEMVLDGRTRQQVCVRFNALPIPPGATIALANVQFTADSGRARTVSSGTGSLTIRAIASDDTGPCDSTAASRPKTTASVVWSNVPTWAPGAKTTAQLTPNLAAVLQEVIDRPGWAAGNDLAIWVTSTSNIRRSAESFNSFSARAAILHVEW